MVRTTALAAEVVAAAVSVQRSSVGGKGEHNPGRAPAAGSRHTLSSAARVV